MRRGSGFRGLADAPHDLAFLRKARERFLREDQGAVRLHFEHAATRRDQLAVDSEDLLQLGRQTGGARLVVSSRAVFDRDPHAVLLVAISLAARAF
jgi:hypothetical protein